MELERLFDLFQEMKDKASVKAVFGKPEVVGEKTIITVAQVAYGFGLGFGEGREEPTAEEGEASSGRGGGGGGGLRARPVAVLEITPEETRVVPVVDGGRIAMAGMALGAWFLFLLARTVGKILGTKRG
ncbi:MAG: GerW family sporulation protein [Anaerolineae bacterium]